MALGLTLTLTSGAFAQADPCASPAVAKKSVAITRWRQPLVLASTSPIYVCGFYFDTYGAYLTYGQSPNCFGDQTRLTGLLQGDSVYPGGMTVLSVPAGNTLCSAGGHAGFLTYVQQ